MRELECGRRWSFGCKVVLGMLTSVNGLSSNQASISAQGVCSDVGGLPPSMSLLQLKSHALNGSKPDQEQLDFKVILRNNSHPVKQARTRRLALIQSYVEEHLVGSELVGRQLFTFTQILLEIDRVLENFVSDSIQSSDPLSEMDQLDLGYEGTLLEAYLAEWGLLDQLLPDQSTINRGLLLDLAKACDTYSWQDPRTRDFYERTIALVGDTLLPGDAGWANVAIGNLGVLLENQNHHMYRKVPETAANEYDFDFAVYNLPEEGDAPLKIGLVADWGAGTPQSLKLIQEMKSQGVNMVIHLGDVYYSGTVREAHKYFYEPMKAVFGDKIPVFNIPGNHDYYAGGEGFYQVIDKLGQQEASYFCLRGKTWQLVAVDTGLIDNFHLLLKSKVGSKLMHRIMTFLPDDQRAWARHQLQAGEKLGLKTIMLSHHQLFSARHSVGQLHGGAVELAGLPDRIADIYKTAEFQSRPESMPGSLPDAATPTVNTRLLKQFPPEVLSNVAAWFWGHEHSHIVFEPYAGLERGRCIGHGSIGEPIDWDIYSTDPHLVGTPWGGPPLVREGSQIGKGDAFWGHGFATLTFLGTQIEADYYQLLDTWQRPNPPTWGAAEKFYSEIIQ